MIMRLGSSWDHSFFLPVINVDIDVDVEEVLVGKAVPVHNHHPLLRRVGHEEPPQRRSRSDRVGARC